MWKVGMSGLVLAVSMMFGVCQELIENFPSPHIPREFRGVWIATVGNIDWPSRSGMSSSEMQKELALLIRSARATGFNAVIFQVRPACEVIYPSLLEPWSEVLTGTCGKAPDGGFDPLAFAIQEAHGQGMELHAWINPFRARHHTAKSPPPSNHVSVLNPKWVRQYNSYLWLDPGIQEAQEHTLAIVSEILSRYNVDGIHLDDYFYPYPEKKKNGQMLEFPDWSTYEGYRRQGGDLNHPDWRRLCIDQFVSALYSRAHEVRPTVKVGISPFGIWRPGHPEGIVGKDSFESLHADSRKWFNLGWMDYCVPQLYWKLTSPGQPYEPLQNWWAHQNLAQRHLYPGLNLSNAGLGKWDASEIFAQIEATRRHPGAQGNVHFSARYLLAEAEHKLGWKLKDGLYSYPAIVPEMPWLNRDQPRPLSPRVVLKRGVHNNQSGWVLNWLPPQKYMRIRHWVVQRQIRGQWIHTLALPQSKGFFIADDPAQEMEILSVSLVDQLNQQSSSVGFKFQVNRATGMN